MAKKNKAISTISAPSGEKRKKSAVPPPLISCGKVEKNILKYFIKIGNDRFNISEFSRVFSVARSTVDSSLKSLISKGLVSKIYLGHYTITTKGKAWINGSEGYRTVCRDEPTLSYIRDHKFTFEIPVLKWPRNWERNQVASLNKDFAQKTIHNFSKNNPLSHFVFMENVDVNFTTTKVRIKPKNIFVNDHGEAAELAIIKAHNVIVNLINCGFGLKNNNGFISLIQTEGHYAEVNTVLSEFFEKHAKGFKVIGNDGNTLFWIDHSDGHREDETATEEARNRLNKQMFAIMDNDSMTIPELEEDLNTLKKIVSDLVKIQLINTKPNTKLIKKDFERPNYVGQRNNTKKRS